MEGRVTDLLKALLECCVGIAGIAVLVVELVSPGYVLRTLVALDILANVLLFGEVETISARLGEAQANGNWFAARACDVLDLFDPEHCEKSFKGD